MKKLCWIAGAGMPVIAGAMFIHVAAQQGAGRSVLTGQAAFIDYRSMKAGTFRKITVADLPQPFATESARNNARLVPRPADAWPQAPAGFKVDLFASELQGPRQTRLAPNGDIVVAETRAGT